MESGGVILFVSVGVVFTAHKYNENTLPVYQKKKKVIQESGNWATSFPPACARTGAFNVTQPLTAQASAGVEIPPS